jgi:hypothetical protein
MFQWLLRLFRRKKEVSQEPTVHAADLAVIPYDDPSEARIDTRLVGRAQAKQIEEAKAMVLQSHDLTLSQAHAVLSVKDEGPRAEVVVQPEDGMAVPILPADLAPQTVAVPRVAPEDAEATRRLPPLSERMGGKSNRRRGLEDEA